MEIDLQDAGKRYMRDWIFRHLDLHISAGKRLAVLGGNGSGKSTLLKILSGHLSLSEGNRKYEVNGKIIHDSDVFKHVSIASPYIELNSLFTLRESIDFHFKFKTAKKGLSTDDIISRLNLTAHSKKQIRNFSSGMKQRTKLGLAILSESKLLLLDEPASNLDPENVQWYRDILTEFRENESLVVCSNFDEREHDMCQSSLNLSDLIHSDVQV